MAVCLAGPGRPKAEPPVGPSFFPAIAHCGGSSYFIRIVHPPLGMDVPEHMCRMIFRGKLSFLAEFPRHVLNELEHFMPEELFFKGTDHSIIACTGWTLRMCTWHAHNIGPPDIIPGPASTAEVFALHFKFPCTLLIKLSLGTTVWRLQK